MQILGHSMRTPLVTTELQGEIITLSFLSYCCLSIHGINLIKFVEAGQKLMLMFTYEIECILRQKSALKVSRLFRNAHKKRSNNSGILFRGKKTKIVGRFSMFPNVGKEFLLNFPCPATLPCRLVAQDLDLTTHLVLIVRNLAFDERSNYVAVFGKPLLRDV